MAQQQPEAPLSPKKLTRSEKELMCLRLRQAGQKYSTIAKQVGYSHASGARKAVARALARVQKETQETGMNFVLLQKGRYEQLLRTFMLRALKGNVAAANFCRQVLGDMNTLMGFGDKEVISNTWIQINQISVQVDQEESIAEDPLFFAEVLDIWEQVQSRALLNEGEEHGQED